MAIVRTAGTEIIRCHHFEDIDDTQRVAIFGVQHHIYTVLSVIVCPETLATAGNTFKMSIKGYDILGNGTGQDILICQAPFSAAKETFVWNDKFSFNGAEPTGFGGALDSAADQNAVADQGSGTSQQLMISATENADSFEVHVTFIDQNNS